MYVSQCVDFLSNFYPCLAYMLIFCSFFSHLLFIFLVFPSFSLIILTNLYLCRVTARENDHRLAEFTEMRLASRIGNLTNER